MNSLAITPNHTYKFLNFSVIQKTPLFISNFPISPNFPLQIRSLSYSPTTFCSQSPSNPLNSEENNPSLVEDLRVPESWLNPSKALKESDWLRLTLHKWLDDEYCPEDTNVEISKVAAKSYYESLIQKRTDLGDILLKMAVELESISYQDSFHGAFSSANAAVNLILQRIIELEA